MALLPFKLPRLQIRLPIVSTGGNPTTEFHRLLNLAFEKIEGQVNEIINVQQDIIDLQTVQTAQIAQIQNLLGIAAATNQAAQSAQQAANDAQATADEALGGGTVSGFADNPSMTVLGGFGWVNGPLVSLTGVVAGDLTISGTGPIQDGDVEIVSGGVGYKTFYGQFRVVEIVGMTETTVFTGNMSAYQGGMTIPATVSNDSSAAVSAFTSARSSTGAVDYRVDFQSTSGDIDELRGYLFVRRAA